MEITDSQRMPHAFNYFFAGIGKFLAEKSPWALTVEEFMGLSLPVSFAIISTTTMNFFKLSQGCTIAVQVLTELISQWLKTQWLSCKCDISSIINCSFSSAIVAPDLKVAKIASSLTRGMQNESNITSPYLVRSRRSRCMKDSNNSLLKCTYYMPFSKVVVQDTPLLCP